MNSPSSSSTSTLFRDAIDQHQQAVSSLMSYEDHILELSRKMLATIDHGGKIILFGNGGSASDAQHIAAELVGRFGIERDGLPCISLTTDSSILTAVGNDYGFDYIFSRQVNALACPGDLIIGISTSGNSQNIVEGIKAARKKNCFTAALTGHTGGFLLSHADLCIRVSSQNTASIQECHIIIGHILCSLIDSHYESRCRHS